MGRSPYTSWSGWLKKEDCEIISQALSNCNLTLLQHKKISQVSDGERQRAMIARCLAQRTDLILLDEPTAGVDIELRQNLWENVKHLNKQGVTIILTTHYLMEAEEMCNRIGIISKGNLIALDLSLIHI